MSDIEQAPPGVDITVPSVARMYDYFLGGTDNFEVDRIAGEKIRANMPEAMDTAWANRGFLQRSVRWLAEQGIRQFIDIGAGLPTMNNTHDAAQAVIPDARILYVDNDPLVRVHANKLLEGATGTAFITADFRDPDGLFGQQTAQEAIDFTEPVGLLVVALTHFVPDEDDPWGLIQRYMSRLAPGSYLALSAATDDRQSARALGTIKEEYSKSTAAVHMRTRAEVTRLFTGLELVPPYDGAGREISYTGEWGAEDPVAADSDGSRWAYCGVARKTA
ncbi:SAM-dependent methyltransferase [Actinomadura sp. BRA 177]|uniref:SAM-dependent methyltransferase n=1 Tax=Actinomadura sp. BRA 177 TaxID=2745202 RepID=UPI0015951E22|nr:SAM-dependent methyltransferase [Actinomadura sp. BRA 177]NVI88458.1 SAM-dependent methyltransferase [Actinomadura sp. BRA 177]